LALDAKSVPALVNWSEVQRLLGHDEAVLPRLDEALRDLPDAAPLHYSRGMTLVRLGRKKEAAASLARAATLESGHVDYQYAHAVALLESEGGNRALAVVDAALQLHPEDARLLRLKKQLEK
jgi:tetratricopeptide (TPR) repeat protein